MNYNKNFSIDMKVSYICQNEYNYFLNKTGVVGLALGYKITKGFSNFKKCITVFVKKKLPLRNLSRENIIPISYKGIETDVIESGVFKVASLTSKVRPVINGYSIGNILAGYSGTCGCLVHDKDIYILGSNHVLAINNSAPIGSDILQPGTFDGGKSPKDVIGKLARFVPIQYKTQSYTPENFVDGALCIVDRHSVTPNIAFVGIPHGTSKASLNLDVQKVGRTTELTHGKITNLYGTTIVMNQMQQEALFKNQIITTSMSSIGDSGALLLTKNNYALGVLMSGVDDISVYNPIDEVLKALNVELVTS